MASVFTPTVPTPGGGGAGASPFGGSSLAQLGVAAVATVAIGALIVGTIAAPPIFAAIDAETAPWLVSAVANGVRVAQAVEAVAASETGLVIGGAGAGGAVLVAEESAPTASKFAYYMSQVEKLDVSTAPSTAVFYSGPGNRALAEAFAAENGATTLEMTPGGAWLDAQKLFEPG